MKILLGIVAGMFMYAVLGCVSMRYGDMTNLNKMQLEKIADETVAYLSSYWLPAKSKIMLVQRPVREGNESGIFDQLLEDRLRKVGYQVMKHGSDRHEENIESNGEVNGYVPLKYVIDNDEPTGLYRMAIYIGNDVIGGVFMQGSDGRMQQSGMWTHRVGAS